MAVLSLSLSAAEWSLADDHLETGITIITGLIFAALSLIKSCAFGSLSLCLVVLWFNVLYREFVLVLLVHNKD